MRRDKISDHDAEALLSGRAPEARADLAALAASISEFRSEALEATARPSAELTSLLAEGIPSSPIDSLPTTAATRRRVTMVSRIKALGLTAKIALGAGVVAVALAATTGAGAAGVLPDGVQDTFDQVVSTIVPAAVDETEEGSTPTDEPTDEPTTEPTYNNFGGWVSERAQDPDKIGREFGAETSEAARMNGENHQPSSGDDGGTGETEDTDNTQEAEHGKPANTPGGKKSH